jgi:hypothetical protein
MPYGTVAADVIQNTTGYSLGAGNASIMKNRIINGAMVIDQRNGGASIVATTSPTYTVDRFYYAFSQSGKVNLQQNLSSVTPPSGYTNYFGFNTASVYAPGAAENFTYGQNIEGFNTADLGWGTANAKTVTLSFWVRSSLTGTFGGSVYNNGGLRSYPFSYTISSANTWEQKTVTIAGDTSGTWLTNNGIGITVTFSIGTGSTYLGAPGAWGSTLYLAPTGQTNLLGTSAATWYITGVQLEVGSSATGFEYVNYQTSLANCQRYYGVANMNLSGYTGPGTANVYKIMINVQMRATPTITVTSSTNTNTTGATILPVGNGHLQFESIGAGMGGYISNAIANISAEL